MAHDEETPLQFVIHRFYKQIEGIDVKTAGLAETREVLHLLGHDGSVLFLHTTTATRGPTLRNKVERYKLLSYLYLSSVNHEPSILTMRRDGQKRKIIRKMCI